MAKGETIDEMAARLGKRSIPFTTEPPEEDTEGSTFPLVGTNTMWINAATLRKALQYYFDKVVFKADAPFVVVIMQASDTKEFHVVLSDKAP